MTTPSTEQSPQADKLKTATTTLTTNLSTALGSEHPLVAALRVGQLDDFSQNQALKSDSSVKVGVPSRDESDIDPKTEFSDVVSVLSDEEIAERLADLPEKDPEHKRGAHLRGTGNGIKRGRPRAKPIDELEAESGVEDNEEIVNDFLGARIKVANALTRETPEHRMMLVYKSQGYSNREIAKLMDVSTQTVANLCAQKWARRRLLELITDNGKDPIAELLKGSVEDSIYTLIELRDDRKVAPSVRLGSANAILDRAQGKPVQRVESLHANLTPKTEEEIDARLRELRREAGLTTD